jgi:hypothetical protein
MPPNANPFATDDSDPASQPVPQPAAPQIDPSSNGAQAAPTQPSPLLQYYKTVFSNFIDDPLGIRDLPPPPPPNLTPTYPALTPEQAAIPYRAAARSYDALDRGRKTLQAFFNGQPVSDEDLTAAFMGGSGIMQPLRGIGDIVNYFRGTNYPHRPTAPPNDPASPPGWPLPPNAT